MRTVEGVIRNQTVWLDNVSLETYEGERVIVLLPNQNTGVQTLQEKTEKRLRYFAEKELGSELSVRTVAEIDRSIREMRNNERF